MVSYPILLFVCFLMRTILWFVDLRTHDSLDLRCEDQVPQIVDPLFTARAALISVSVAVSTTSVWRLAGVIHVRSSLAIHKHDPLCLRSL